MFKGLLFFIKFGWKHEKRYIIYIILSHRLASTQFCDSIAVFENSRIVEYVSHQELIKNNKTYSKLYTTQSSYYK